MKGILSPAGNVEKKLDWDCKICDNQVKSCFLFDKEIAAGMDEKTNLEITSEGHIAVVTFKAASISSIEAVEAISKQINGFIEKNHPNRLVIDFEQVRFFSSQMLGVLLSVRAKLETYGGEVVISAIYPQLHRIFKITRLDEIFRFFPDRSSAVKAVNTN